MIMTPDLSKDKLGYEIHTNHELGMMLRGEKPLAVFSDVEDVFLPVLWRYFRKFDRHVQAGRFVKREHRMFIDIRGNRQTLLTVLYALLAEAWRIDEMINLRHHLHCGTSSWTAEHERKEGSLLGYSDEENDVWIATRYPFPSA
jgi:hypothetical protein